jgi:hypothetical protein
MTKIPSRRCAVDIKIDRHPRGLNTFMMLNGIYMPLTSSETRRQTYPLQRMGRHQTRTVQRLRQRLGYRIGFERQPNHDGQTFG